MGANRIPDSERMLLLAGAALVVILSSFGITQFPLPWWDEGWTLSVAKNWVTLGHYGHVLNGVPAGPSLSAHLPVVAIIAASFLTFGVGLAQARLAMVLCMVITLILLYLITRRFSSRGAAVLAVILVCVAPAQWDLSALVVGRNVLGEFPALMFILGGVLSFLSSNGTRWAWIVLSGTLFGLALASKAQVVPFVLVGLGITLGLQMRHHWRRGIRTGVVLAVALLVMTLVGWARTAMLASTNIPADPVVGLTAVTAMVFDPEIRLGTLRFALLGAAPVSIALGVAAVRIVRSIRIPVEDHGTEAARTLLAIIAGSWLVWFVTLSIGWARYGFPAFFLAAPFAAELLRTLFTVVRKAPAAPGCRMCRIGAGLLLLFFTTISGRQLSLGVRAIAETVHPSGLEETAFFVNHATPPGSLIETYESELLFLLERPVHVPPAQLNVDLIRKNWLKGPTTMGYDLSSVNARYLIIGAFGTGLYDSLLVERRYEPVRTCGGYMICRRTGP